MRNRVVAVSSNLVAEQKKKSGNALFIRLPRLVATIQTPQRFNGMTFFSLFLLTYLLIFYSYYLYYISPITQTVL